MAGRGKRPKDIIGELAVIKLRTGTQANMILEGHVISMDQIGIILLVDKVEYFIPHSSILYGRTLL